MASPNPWNPRNMFRHLRRPCLYSVRGVKPHEKTQRDTLPTIFMCILPPSYDIVVHQAAGGRRGLLPKRVKSIGGENISAEAVEKTNKENAKAASTAALSISTRPENKPSRMQAPPSSRPTPRPSGLLRRWTRLEEACHIHPLFDKSLTSPYLGTDPA